MEQQRQAANTDKPLLVRDGRPNDTRQGEEEIATGRKKGTNPEVKAVIAGGPAIDPVISECRSFGFVGQ